VFSEEVFLLEENQFGFRKSYSTTDSICTLFSFFEILKKTSSENTRSLSFKIAANSLPRQLRMVIGRKFLGSKGLPLFLYIGLIPPISQISGKKPVSKKRRNYFVRLSTLRRRLTLSGE
jgi:hypothetical protein